MKKIKLILISMVVLSFVNIAYSQPTSPSQPEFSKFQPVGGENLVNTYNGAFNYNILLLTVPGEDGFDFPINMFYNSDVGYGEEASWVGYGWSLNPGAINRQKRGFPDDIKNQIVKYWTATEPIVCHTIELSIDGIETFSSKFPVSADGKVNFQWHSRLGPIFTASAGISVTLGTLGDIGFGVSNGEVHGRGNISFSPMGYLLSDIQFSNKIGNEIFSHFKSSYASYVDNKIYSAIGMRAHNQYPAFTNAYRGVIYTGRVSARIDPVPKVGVDAGLSYTYSKTETDKSIDRRVYGYMYSEDAHYSPFAIMDYYVEKDMGFIEQDKYLGVPMSNKDMFVVSGHGVSGTFSVNNGTINSFRPDHQQSEVKSYTFGVSVNIGADIGVGANIKASPFGKKITISGWDESNYYRGKYLDYLNSYRIKNKFRFHGDLSGEVDFGNDSPISANLGFMNSSYKDMSSFKKNISDLYIMPPGLGTIDLFNSLHYIEPTGSAALYQAVNNYNFVTGTKQITAVTRQDIIDDYQRFIKIYAGTDVQNIKNLPADSIKAFPSISYYDKDIIFEYMSGGSFENHSQFSPYIDENEHNFNEEIAQFIVTNEQGNKYVYGLPVYNRNEREISYGLGDIVNRSTIINNAIIYPQDELSTLPFLSVSGHEQNIPYAGSFLITSILSSDYVDLTFNGPTPDDLGSYVKFSYNRTAGSDKKYDNKNDSEEKVDNWVEQEYCNDARWYKWRNPYNGLSYNKNSLTDPKDDIGSVSMGERENYYLKSIETKSHIAVLITNMMDDTIGDKNFTGSQEVRQDGWDACYQEGIATKSEDATFKSYINSSGDIEQENGVEGLNNYAAHLEECVPKEDLENDMSADQYLPRKVQYLEKIELYKKNYTTNDTWTIENEEPIKTVCLDYDNTTQANGELKNTIDETSGKLTLKKMWYEYGGTKEAYISPYLFDYTYDLAENVFNKSEYYHLKDGYTDLTETPPYMRTDIDAWGNYQDGSDVKESNMIYSVAQNPQPSFDPAAWKLKNLTLPSGGEIKVQYEQDDYAYVHDRPAMVLTQVSGYSLDPDYLEYGEVITISNTILTDSLHLSTVEIENVVTELNNMSISGERMYFKFLCALVGSTVSLNNCQSEYITGYGKLAIAEYDSESGLVIKFSELPIQYGMKEFLKANSGRFNLGDHCNCNNSVDMTKKDSDLIQGQMKGALTWVDNLNGISSISVAPDLSYLRLPLPKGKKGGGIRVKRVLYSDDFDAVHQHDTTKLYGKEYIYKTESNISSGVAGNEPAKTRNENPLVGFLKTRNQNTGLNLFVNGKIRTDFEGPYGESLLPGPSVGYSRVITKDIHDHKSCDGFSVEKFFTYKDYPMDYKSHILPSGALSEPACANTDLNKHPFTNALNFMLFSSSNSEFYGFQGYRFIMTDIPGNPKSVSTYGGTYSDTEFASKERTSAVEYTYYEPGETQKISDGYGWDDSANLGREMEVVEERTAVDETVNDITISFDLDLTFAGIIPIFLPSFSASISMSHSKLYKHVLSKVISYPAIVKEVKQYQDGIEHVTRNIAFDKYSGQPIITESFDEFDGMDYPNDDHSGSIKTFSLPAYEIYPELGPQSLNEGLVYTNKLMSAPKLYRYTDGRYILESTAIWRDFCKLNQHFVPGDIFVIYKYDFSDTLGYARAIDVGENIIEVKPIYADEFRSSELALGGNMHVAFKLIRSGRANRLAEQAGTISKYGVSNDGSEYVLKTTTPTLTISPAESGLMYNMNAWLYNLVANNQEYTFTFNPYQGGTITNNFGHIVDINAGLGCYIAASKYNEGGDSVTVIFKVIDETQPSDPSVCQFKFGFNTNNPPGAYFTIDETHHIVLSPQYTLREYIDNNGDTQTYKYCYCSYCMNFEDTDTGIYEIDEKGILSSSVVTYRDSLMTDSIDVSNGGTFEVQDDFSKGKRGRLKISESFIYEAGDEIFDTDVQQDRGIYEDYYKFNWKNQQSNNMVSSINTQPRSADYSGWLKTAEITKYNKHGQAVEFKDLNDVYSAAKHYETPAFSNLTKLVASNAKHTKVDFESCEEILNATSTRAHSGSQSISLPATQMKQVFDDYTVDIGDTLLIRLWASHEDQCDINVTVLNWYVIAANGGSTLGTGSFLPIVRVGEWTLCEAELVLFPPNDGYICHIDIGNNLSYSKIFIDDIRIQPYNSEMQCYVYDKDLKIQAILNDQNMATFYQYNMRGELVRNIAETITGRRTTTEQHMNYNKVERSETDYSNSLPTIKSDLKKKFNKNTNINGNPNYKDLTEPQGTNINSSFDIFKFKYKDGNSKANFFNLEQEKINQFFKSQKDSTEKDLPSVKQQDQSKGQNDEKK